MKKNGIEFNPILKMTFEFSLAIIESDVLNDMKKFILSNQLNE